MNEPLTLLAALALGIAIGAAGLRWLTTRKSTTRAEAIKLAQLAYKEALKLPSASDAIELAQAQAKVEAAAQADFLAAVSKAASVPPVA